MHQLKVIQRLPCTMAEAWNFFSSPQNLKRITPSYMGFDIISDTANETMYPGMIIRYVVRPLLNLPIQWTTEITHVSKPEYFVDEQRFGPYAFWHHKHFFKEIPGGVEMTDIVDYRLPFGRIGVMITKLLVKRRLDQIFDYRFKKLEELLGKL